MKIAAHAAVVSSLAAATLSAQTTTWTSFEDRRGHTMASTPSGGVVMFGGQSVTAPGQTLGDTNRLSPNNQTWTGETDGLAPRTEHAMAATTVSAQPLYIVFGGLNESGQPATTVVNGVPTAPTWRYDGSAWGDLTPASSMAPTPRSGHAMATNTVTQTMLLFGGFDGTNALNDVWELDPASGNWTPHTVNGTPPALRFGHSMAYDPSGGGASGRFYVFGGSPFRSDLWEFDSYTSTWTQKLPPASPPGRRKAAMAYLVGQGEIVLFGGLSAGGVVRNDTWSYDPSANQWRQENPANVPPARYEHALTADATGNNLILLGGTNGAGEVLEGTWLWSSTQFNWIEQLPTPTDRNGAAMAYDSARGRHVVFGGRAVTGGQDLDETWEIDGLNWRRRTPSAKPSLRSDAGMVFDSARNRTVLYGGRSQATGQELGDTWEWTGSTWAMRVLPNNPPAAGGTQPVYDPVRAKVWMLAATGMWSFNGVDWTGPSEYPQPRGWSGQCFDTARGRLVMFGGENATGQYLSECWEAHQEVVWVAETCSG